VSAETLIHPEGASRPTRYDVLFEPVQIGPLTAKNRFFQVPHCNGMGYRDVSALAAMRQVKAEGGWAVVCTEEVEIHPSSDLTPYIEGRLWDDRDIPALARIADAIHTGGGLAGIELTHNGMAAANLTSREVPLGPSDLPVLSDEPVQARRMTKVDIEALRRWHRAAIRRSLRAGFDLVYVYAGHGLTGPQHFLSPRYNHRCDEYGGSLTNRMRLLRELIEGAVEECAGKAAVAVRLCVDELSGSAGLTTQDTKQVVAELAELPDLWDFMVGDWSNDSSTSRFSPEGAHTDKLRGFKELTTKPVVGVGRFTSPDLMVDQIRSGIMDLVGAARPSIADPFLPRKIELGLLEDIRECIGCNICVSGDHTMSPIRCTQNPTMGEEWRRGWHPERVAPADRRHQVLVVGAGPAGMEAARVLGHRKFDVAMLERGRELGGRVRHESRLPGLSAWIRVVDYREYQLANLSTVEVYRQSPVTADDALEFGFSHIVIATGATWRRDGVGRRHHQPMPIDTAAEVLTPDDILAGGRPKGSRVVIFDDDHYYLAGVLAELLTNEGFDISIVCPKPQVSGWTRNTLEVDRIQARLLRAGVQLRTNQALVAVGATSAVLNCAYTASETEVAADAVVLVTARVPNNALLEELTARQAEWPDAGVHRVIAVGDAEAPSTIAAAVYSGHKLARGLDRDIDEPALAIRREVTRLSDDYPHPAAGPAR
jgi:dimethylamine/trimethylamine dehydrogenase